MAILTPADLPAGPPLDNVTQKKCVDEGKAPDITLLEPGDIILYAPMEPTGFQKTIQSVTSRQPYLPASAAEWTHAAVSAGGDTIIEAVTRTGVQKASIFDDCFDFKIQVRRAKGFSELERMRIALIAACAIKQKYDYYAAAMIYAKTRWPERFEKFPLPSTSRIICSQLVSTSYMEAAVASNRPPDVWPEKVVIGGKEQAVKNMDITPAHLSCASTFSDVTIGWRPLLK
ncbi:hypothetical protein LDL36_18465 [Komagataeibacter sp. FNDCR1]|nr:hypothetical protein [Komagataeibacter sp. FNDCR1]